MLWKTTYLLVDNLFAIVFYFNILNLSKILILGPKAEEYRGLLSLKYPMEHGIVTDWNDMERIWQYVYSNDQLKVFIDYDYYTHFQEVESNKISRLLFKLIYLELRIKILELIFRFTFQWILRFKFGS